MVNQPYEEHEKRYRIMMCQTEITNAHNGMRKKLDQQFIHGAPYVYVTARDASVCKICAPLEGNIASS